MNFNKLMICLKVDIPKELNDIDNEFKGNLSFQRYCLFFLSLKQETKEMNLLKELKV